MKIKTLLLLCFCSHFCFSQTVPIEIQFNLDNMETCDWGLTDFIESIEYIPLETKDECLIGPRMRFDFDDNHIIVIDNVCKSAYLFDRKGRFLRTIGSEGGGPEEVVNIQNVFLDSDHVIIISREKALFFNKQGDFLWSTAFPIDHRYVATYFHEQFLRIAESYTFRDSTYNVYQIYNQKGNLVKEAIASIPIPIKKDPRWRISYSSKDILSAYTYQNMPHVREYLNDTVYMIDQLNRFRPKYILNMGKYKVTPEIQADVNHFGDRIQDKVVIMDIVEMADRLLIQYFHNWKIESCCYDKKKCEFYKFNSSGYPNDYDGGIDFMISADDRAVQKNQYIRTAFLASDFISFLDQNKHQDRKIKGPKCAIQAFNKLAQRIDPEDNPIIMIVKLKE